MSELNSNRGFEAMLPKSEPKEEEVKPVCGHEFKFVLFGYCIEFSLTLTSSRE